jgi:hypothetical protein
MSHTAVSRISSVLSGRRLVLLLGLIVVAFVMASMGRVEGASADTNTNGGEDEGITIDCPLGDGYKDPGTMISLPSAGGGALPPVTYICGDDGKWHKVAAIVRPPSTGTNPPVVKAASGTLTN